MAEENETSQNTENANGSKEKVSLGDLRGVFIAGAWVLIGLLLVAKFWPNLPQRMAFFTGHFFNLLIAFAVIAQVVIYRKQWHVMERQWEMAKEQTKIMGESLVIQSRAYVGVHSIETPNPKVPNSILIRFENTGIVPADHIKIRLHLYVYVSKKWVPERKKELTAYPVVNSEYGYAPLFRGNFQIPIKVSLDDILTTKELTCIAQGRGMFVLAGSIQYQDGFSANLKQQWHTPINFRYVRFQWIPNEISWTENVDEDK